MNNFFEYLVLVIVDGMGVAPPSETNAITTAKTPNLDRFWNKYPHTYLHAAGSWAGLQDNEPGNTIVGHRNIAAGQILDSSATLMNNSLKAGSFPQNPEIISAVKTAVERRSALQIVINTNQESSANTQAYVKLIIQMALEHNLDKDSLFFHIVAESRSGIKDQLEKIMDICVEHRMGRVASVVGSKYAHNKIRNWDYTNKVLDAWIDGEAHLLIDYGKYILKQEKQNIPNYELDPIFLMVNENDTPATFNNRDSIVFLNPNQQHIAQLVFGLKKYVQAGKIQKIHLLTMDNMGSDLTASAAFSSPTAENHLGRIVSKSNLPQTRIALTDKFSAVTYFFNQNTAHPLPGETQLEVPSQEATPELNQKLMTEVTIERLAQGDKFAVINYSGADYFAHQQDFTSAVETVGIIDNCLGKLSEWLINNNGGMIITSDHGNAEYIKNEPDKGNKGYHTTNQVPLLILGNNLVRRALPIGTLADIAPTALNLMGLDTPAEMTGKDLLKNN